MKASRLQGLGERARSVFYRAVESAKATAAATVFYAVGDLGRVTELAQHARGPGQSNWRYKASRALLKERLSFLKRLEWWAVYLGGVSIAMLFAISSDWRELTVGMLLGQLVFATRHRKFLMGKLNPFIPPYLYRSEPRDWAFASEVSRVLAGAKARRLSYVFVGSWMSIPVATALIATLGRRRPQVSVAPPLHVLEMLSAIALVALFWWIAVSTVYQTLLIKLLLSTLGLPPSLRHASSMDDRGPTT